MTRVRELVHHAADPGRRLRDGSRVAAVLSIQSAGADGA